MGEQLLSVVGFGLMLASVPGFNTKEVPATEPKPERSLLPRLELDLTLVL